MYIPSQEKHKIFRYILEEGCILVEDDIMGKHPEIGVDNKYVMSVTRSMTDKDWLVKTFVMRHGYYRLTEDGIFALKEKLCVPDHFKPITHSGDYNQEEVIEALKCAMNSDDEGKAHINYRHFSMQDNYNESSDDSNTNQSIENPDTKLLDTRGMADKKTEPSLANAKNVLEAGNENSSKAIFDGGVSTMNFFNCVVYFGSKENSKLDKEKETLNCEQQKKIFTLKPRLNVDKIILNNSNFYCGSTNDIDNIEFKNRLSPEYEVNSSESVKKESDTSFEALKKKFLIPDINISPSESIDGRRLSNPSTSHDSQLMFVNNGETKMQETHTELTISHKNFLKENTVQASDNVADNCATHVYDTNFSINDDERGYCLHMHDNSVADYFIDNCQKSDKKTINK